MGVDDAIDITTEDRKTVLELLQRHLPGTASWAYGSRVKWTSRPQSDLDLVVFATPEQRRQVGDLREAFEESNLPFRVDLFVWDDVPESFKDKIEAQRVVLTSNDVGTAPGWRRRDVSDLIQDGLLIVGDGYRAKNSELSRSGLPFARAGNIADGFRFFGADRFPEDGLDKIGDKASRPGDVVFTSKGTVGRFAFVRGDTEHFVYSPQLCFWRSLDHKVIDPYFLYCWMRGPEFFRQFRGVAGQTDMAEYVSLTDQRRMFVTLPALAEQRPIARVLRTLDDKIELNRRMNATLEAMARALFRSWFVDFDPVRAKTEGRDTGLPKDVANLFPDRLVKSEIGEVPEGWDIECLAEHFEAIKGVSYKGSGLGLAGIPLHNLNSVHEGGGYKYEGIKFYTGDYADRHVVRHGDVIVANTEQGHDRLLIGYAAIVPRFFGEHGICSHHVYRLRPRHNGRLSTPYLHLLLNSPWMHDIVSGYANGTTVNMLPIDAVQKPMVSVPSKALLATFDALALRLEHRREQAVGELRTLGVLRDTLLPKLVSGEIRMRDAEKLVGAVA